MQFPVVDNKAGLICHCCSDHFQPQIRSGDRRLVVWRNATGQEPNLFETQEMTAGLSLSVKPSLGASGFLRLDVEAKLTTLGAVIGDTPSEHGQMLHNTVIARDGEPILLGGFKTSETERSRSGVPILGRFLPFLFSREVERTIDREILLVLTPRVVSIEDGVAPPAMD